MYCHIHCPVILPALPDPLSILSQLYVHFFLMAKSSLAAHKLMSMRAMVFLLGGAPLTKTDSPCLESYQLLVVPWLGLERWWLMNLSLFPARVLIGLVLNRPSALSPSCCEFNSAAAILLYPEDTVRSGPPQMLALKTCCSLFLDVPWALWWKPALYMFQLWLSTSLTLIFCTLFSCKCLALIFGMF